MKFSHDWFTNTANDQAALAGKSSFSYRPAATHHTDFLPLQRLPGGTVLKQAGEAALRRLVAQHQRNLADGLLAERFSALELSPEEMTARLGDYLVAACSRSLRTDQQQLLLLDYPLEIDESGREVWLAKLWLAFDQTDFPVLAREELWNWIEAASIHLIKHRTQRTQPVRYAYRTVLQLFAPAVKQARSPVAKRATAAPIALVTA